VDKDVAADGRVTLLGEWLVGLRILHVAHSIAAERFERWSRTTGVATAVLSAVVGTAIFTALAASTRTEVRVAVGVLSLLAAALGVAQLIWNYPQLAQQHRQAAVRYGALRRSVEKRLVDSAPIGQTDIDEISARWEEIEKEAPSVPTTVRSQTRRKIDAAARQIPSQNTGRLPTT